MPIEVGIWKMGETPEKVHFSAIETESKLEEVLEKDLSIVDSNLLLIGRQVATSYGKFIDLMAIDREGDLVIIELKRDKTPREVVAQVLDYGSWVRDLEEDEIAAIYDAYAAKYLTRGSDTSLDQAYCDFFNVDNLPDSFNESHKLVVVAGQLDQSTERIINYLAEEYGVEINAIFFRFFKDGDSEYLSRAWLMDPEVVEARVEQKREKLPWNGEYYVSFGCDDHRDWDDAQKYGFISAGGGTWYTNSLKMLEVGARIWVNIPGEGYVGVGRVTATSVPAHEFRVEGEKRALLRDLPIKGRYLEKYPADDEKAEHVVGVDWIKTVPRSHAVKEKGFFGNQNSAARPKAKKWAHTIDRLKVRFGIDD